MEPIELVLSAFVLFQEVDTWLNIELTFSDKADNLRRLGSGEGGVGFRIGKTTLLLTLCLEKTGTYTGT